MRGEAPRDEPGLSILAWNQVSMRTNWRSGPGLGLEAMLDPWSWRWWRRPSPLPFGAGGGAWDSRRPNMPAKLLPDQQKLGFGSPGFTPQAWPAPFSVKRITTF